jgi:hypothetical protein
MPNPKTIIRLDAQDKQGRYVRIQLLGKNHLSLAEVQVIGGIWITPSFDCTIFF